MKNLYSAATISASDFGSVTDAEEIFVLCDVYTRKMNGEDGSKRGMPILYYRANTAGYLNPNKQNEDPIPTDEVGLFYRYTDNDDLVDQLGVPWETSGSLKHYMASSNTPGTEPPGAGPLQDFYWRINNDNIEIEDGRPYRRDSYILISAGNDGFYGTSDDVMNFHKK